MSGYRKILTPRKKNLTKDSAPVFEFHITRKARDRYDFKETLFSLKGEVIFANFTASREFAQRINEKREADKTVRAGELNAMGLLDEILHYLIESYRRELNPVLFDKMEAFLIKSFGQERLDELLAVFADRFPTTPVYTNQQNVKEYLQGQTGDLSNRHVILEEVLVLWLDNLNPAYQPIEELIDEKELTPQTVYKPMMDKLNQFFQTEPLFGPDSAPLLDMLSEPARKYPHSIMAQLDYIRIKWAQYLTAFMLRLLMSMDFIREEEKERFDIGIFGHGPAPLIQFGPEYDYEPERFSTDLDWMPRVVMIAKSTYVWLDQLSKTYQRAITRLDQIPDEALDRLARYGFTGLWLIGLWERSRASERIKKMRGNPEAVASAYSLMAYEIAADLGGDAAYHHLRERAWKRGIRLASDMVPNHMGIDSHWVINHPQWFLQRDHPPFPGYSFNGPDLSDDGRVGIFIEDGYWSNTDAAVVFKRLDRHTGEARYIYHGNDGTSMPWNDTAQLNYLMPEVREAVIQTILHVARKFPIIRFDAAMTLAKKHYQRLWFPQPGTGGDIPSRAEYAMTRQQFDELFPNEFWREVVDRVQQEVPDTLLLAEAFWLMEGYFVRTLGMHRVYNSAFMNMLKMEENEKYRMSIKNVLEFNPQILKRHVNFMNNPDEETAVAQFGKDDKYFGVCVLMCTMPGLPMFGHGQIEGFTEKYGMEYKKAYWDEYPDDNLIRRHEREIFPLLRKRRLFSDVENFLLYDFYTADGTVNENVFSYSNRRDGECSLVVYQNKFDRAAGWIQRSAAYLDREQLVQKTLGEGLDIGRDQQLYICFRDYINGLEYIRSSEELWNSGLYIELEAFKYHVFLDFRQVWHSDDRPYAELAGQLQGQGVPSVEEALDELVYQPIITAFREVVNPGSLQRLGQTGNNKVVEESFTEKLDLLHRQVCDFEKLSNLNAKELRRINKKFDTIRALFQKKTSPLAKYPNLLKGINKELAYRIPEKVNKQLIGRRILLLVPFLDLLKELYAQKKNEDFLDNRLFAKIIQRTFQEMDVEGGTAYQDVLLLKILSAFEHGLEIDKKNPALPFFEELIVHKPVQRFIQIHEFQRVYYFNKEQFETLLSWLFIRRLLQLLQSGSRATGAAKINAAFREMQRLKKLAEAHGYRWDDFLRALG